jgi:hypothetical protein
LETLLLNSRGKGLAIKGNKSSEIGSHVVRAQINGSVKIQLRFALITSHHAAKDCIAAMGAYVAGLFVSNPLFSTELSSIRHSPENNLLADGHGEIVNVLTRKFIAFMTAGVPFLLCAVPDITLAAMHELFIG